MSRVDIAVANFRAGFKGRVDREGIEPSTY